MELGSLRKQLICCKHLLPWMSPTHWGEISVALPASEMLQNSSSKSWDVCRAGDAARWMGTVLGLCSSVSHHGTVSLLQEIAQINEDNLTAYNRCALFALGAAYLNLISQLTTVPTFCQHIHEVRGRVWGQGCSLVCSDSGTDSTSHPWV